MSFFRSREVKKLTRILLLLTALFGGAGFCISLTAGFLVSLFGLVLCGVFLGFTRKRYRDIAALSGQIDLILQGDDRLDFTLFQEGELSILQSDIQKMTVRLREQADALRADKVVLADALADIAHQMRTPMTSIRILASFLAQPGLEESRRMTFSREMEGLLQRVDWLLSTLLKISKIDAGTAVFEKESVSVFALLQKAAEPLEIPMELRGIALELHGAEELVFTGDFHWTAEAVGNILKNAMEHLDEGGKIQVFCSGNALFTQMVIRDSGNGIAPEDLPHIFERFYQGRQAKEGSFGVGLALSRMILSAQNATVKAENHPEGGACFTLKFYHPESLFS